MKKRVLAAVLCLALVLAALPMAALAADGDVARIGEKTYTTLQEAINAAASASGVETEIVLLQDVMIVPKGPNADTLAPQFTVSGGNITLNLNGHTIGYDPSQIENVGSPLYTPVLISVNTGASLTITGEGVIDAELGMNNSYGINVNGGGLVVENGTFYGAITAIQVQTGNLTINGGTFDLAPTVKSVDPTLSEYLINCIDANYNNNTAQVGISGGIFVNFNPAESPEAGNPSFLSSTSTGYASLTPAGDGTASYYVGADVQTIANDAQTGDSITVLNGDAAFNNLPAGTVLTNSGSGSVTLDGQPITSTTTVPATVTFCVVNGRWSDGSTGNKTEVVTMSGGRGTLAAVPTPVANYGYSGGSWGPSTPFAGMTITGDVTFTYTFYETQYAPPTILVQPQPAVVTEGGIATFSVTAVSSNPYNPNDFVATWMVSRDGITWSRVGTGTTLQLPVTAEDDGLQVRCTLQTGNGRRDTTPVTLTVLPGAAVVPGDEEIVDPDEEEGDLAEGTEETPPEETEEIPEEGLEELPEEGEDLPEEPVDVPQTGDAAPAAGLAILLGLAVCALALKKVRAK